MKIVNFQSGLGNQIFFYLMALYLQQKFPKEKVYGYYSKKFLKKHNGLEIGNVFQVELPPANSWSNFITFLIRISHRWIKRIYSTDENYDESAIYFNGYWQDERFFLDNIKKLKFKVDSQELTSSNKCLLQKISETDSVSLHIRRGDYLLPQFAPIYGNICTNQYYQHAIDIVLSHLPNAKFFVFSDDQDWVKQNLKIPHVTFVTGNKGKDSFLDMYLMSKCKAHIIANSTFSYWGAMLSQETKGLTVYPQKWTQKSPPPSIFPKEWIGI